MFCALVLLSLTVTKLFAQAAIQWTEPLLVAGNVEGSNSPAITVDPTGGVHIVWVGSTTPLLQYPDFKSNFIYYSRYDGLSWSPPIDIMLSPDQYSDAQQPSIAADTQGLLHLAWTSPNRSLYYTSAHATEANDSRAWTDPMVLYSAAQTPTILIGPDGKVHILYLALEPDAGIMHIGSDDGGVTWSSPALISDPMVPGQRPPRLSELITGVFDVHGVLHIAWNWEGSVFYSRSTDMGGTWSQPFVVDQPDLGLDQGGASPTLISVGADKDGGVHLVWDASHDRCSCGRYGRWSQDGGQSWSDRQEILFPMQGCLGWNNMALDSGGTLHLIGIARDAAGIVHFWQSYWAGTGWAQPVPLLGISVDDSIWSQIGPDRSRLTIADGNRLVLTWFSNDGKIWYAQGVTDAPRVESPLLQQPAITPDATATPVASPVSGFAESPTSTPLPDVVLSSISTRSAGTGSPLLPAAAGILPAATLVALVIALNLKRRSK